MGALEFTETLIGHLTWPVFAAWLAFLFRDELRHLLRRIKKAETKLGTFDFDQNMEVAAVAAEVAEGQTQTDPEPPDRTATGEGYPFPTPPRRIGHRSIVNKYPFWVQKDYERLLFAIHDWGIANGFPMPDPELIARFSMELPLAGKLIESMTWKGIIPAALVAQIEALERAAYGAAKDPDTIDRPRAFDYKQSVNHVIEQLNNIKVDTPD